MFTIRYHIQCVYTCTCIYIHVSAVCVLSASRVPVLYFNTVENHCSKPLIRCPQVCILYMYSDNLLNNMYMYKCGVKS